jgi:hypothetical protein
MNKRHLMAICALVAVLVFSNISASADESKISQVQTSLSNTTISGYVITAVTFTPQPNPQTPHAFKQQLHTFFFALRSQWLFILFRN